MIKAVADYIYSSYLRYSNKPAIVYKDRIITYEDMFIQASKVASCLIEAIGNEKSPVIVLMHNSPEAIIAFWGIAMSNNIYVPIDYDLPEARLKEISSLLNPAFVVDCSLGFNNSSGVFSCSIKSFYSLLNKTTKESKIKDTIENIRDVDPLYILFTSGSTGVPKGVTVSNRAVIDFTEEASEYMDFSDNEIFLNQAPFYFDASVPDIYCSVRNGATLHIIDRNMFVYPIQIMEYIEKNKINALFWVPSALVTVANLRVLGKRNIQSLNKIMFCGEVMPVKQLNMWRKVLPAARFVNYYGPSEITYACSYYEIDREFDENEVLPIGSAAKNTEIIIINNGVKVTTRDVVGEIYVRGSCLASGYYNAIDKTNEVFVQNPLNNAFPEIVYKTGDLGHYGKNGLIYFDGRKDLQIKRNGYRIELGEIEAVASAIEGIERVACVYREEEKEIVLYYSGDVVDVLGIIKRVLPLYMIPQRVIRLDEMPINSNGKIDRMLLKKGVS